MNKMSRINEIYKCEVCGAITTVLNGGVGTLVCCDKPMVLIPENKTDAATEKHVPVVEKIDRGYKIKVGSVIHPMSNEHLIEWIELIGDGRSYFKYLGPNDEPIVTFFTDASDVKVRAYCNLHGLWTNK